MLQSTPVVPVEPTPKPRVALLVDGDNLSPRLASDLVRRASTYGLVTVKCAFGDMAKPGGWSEAAGYRPVHSGSGKNAGDLRLVIEAMEIVHTRRADVLVVASSDGDFSHLALHLVERGIPVIGMGEAKAPQRFRRACMAFCEVTLEPPAQGPRAQAAVPVDRLDSAIRAVIRAHADATGWLSVSALGSRLSTEHRLSRKDCGRSTWKAYLDSKPDLFRCEGSGHAQRVRLVAP